MLLFLVFFTTRAPTLLRHCSVGHPRRRFTSPPCFAHSGKHPPPDHRPPLPSSQHPPPSSIISTAGRRLQLTTKHPQPFHNSSLPTHLFRLPCTSISPPIHLTEYRTTSTSTVRHCQAHRCPFHRLLLPRVLPAHFHLLSAPPISTSSPATSPSSSSSSIPSTGNTKVSTSFQRPQQSTELIPLFRHSSDSHASKCEDTPKKTPTSHLLCFGRCPTPSTAPSPLSYSTSSPVRAIIFLFSVSAFHQFYRHPSYAPVTPDPCSATSLLLHSNSAIHRPATTAPKSATKRLHLLIWH